MKKEYGGFEIDNEILKALDESGYKWVESRGVFENETRKSLTPLAIVSEYTVARIKRELTDKEPQTEDRPKDGKPKLKWADYIFFLLVAIVIGVGICAVALVITNLVAVALPLQVGYTGLAVFVFLSGLLSFGLYFKKNKISRIPTQALKLVIALWFIGTIGTGIIAYANPSTNNTSTTNVAKLAPYCTRTTPYPMEPKFQRAYSLVKEKIYEMKPDLDRIDNCLDIRYAKSDSELGNAEGVYSYTPLSNDYRILVSPAYRADDDYLTAFLLAHEVMHALANDIRLRSKLDLTSLPEKKRQDYCVGEETRAFTMQMMFLRRLNAGERSSLFDRLYLEEATNQLGPGMQMVKQVLEWTLKQDVNNPMAINTDIDAWIRANPYYQKECSLK